MRSTGFATPRLTKVKPPSAALVVVTTGAGAGSVVVVVLMPATVTGWVPTMDTPPLLATAGTLSGPAAARTATLAPTIGCPVYESMTRPLILMAAWGGATGVRASGRGAGRAIARYGMMVACCSRRAAARPYSEKWRWRDR